MCMRTLLSYFVVVNELDGLKKGRELKGHGNNVAYVQDRARLVNHIK